jgi:ABC-type glycerol-3-phosphate transport system permease component
VKHRWISRRLLNKILYTLFALGLCLVIVFPLIWMSLNSLKPPTEEIRVPPTLLPQRPTLQNYQDLLSMTAFFRYFLNSLFLSVVSAFVAILISLLGVYSISRFKPRYGGLLFFALILIYMLPEVLIVIPYMRMVIALGLGNSLAALTIVYISITTPFAVWMLRSYIETIPVELEEAAMVDGATRFGAFRKVIVPAAMPGIAAALSFTFILAWNEYVYSLVLIQSDYKRTITLGIATLIGDKAMYSWGILCAGAVLAVLPVLVLFVFIQKHLVRGFTAGAVKG